MDSIQPTSLLDALYTSEPEAGKPIIAEHRTEWDAMHPSDADAPQLFHALAQWAEHSSDAAVIARRFADEYTKTAWPHLSILGWSWVQAGLARLAYFDSRLTDAEEACHWVYKNASRAGAPVILLASTDLVLAQSLKSGAKYDEAVKPTASAVQRFDSQGFARMAAFCKTLQGWLLMQSGHIYLANKLWTEALRFFEANNIQNSYIVGNLRFFWARSLARTDHDEESIKAYEAAAGTYLQFDPPHRTLRRVLLDKADQEIRMANKYPARANELFSTAVKDIELAAALLLTDPGDIRNHTRLLLAKANFALYGRNRSLKSARLFSRLAYEFAAQHKDNLMVARARLRQASIEERGSWNEDEPLRKRCLASIYVREALGLAIPLKNARLIARCHLLLGTLYMEEPFCDFSAAEMQWKAAARQMEQHEDSDYLVQKIQALGRQVNAASSKISAGIIITITTRALHMDLEQTVQEVEHAIVSAAAERFGASAAALCRLLGAGTDRIDRHLSAKRRASAGSSNDQEEPLFTVMSSLAFGSRLEDTIHTVEREIIAAAYRLYNGHKHNTRTALGIGHDRLKRAMDEIHQG